MTAVAIYTRLSYDRTGGLQTATTRQSAACNAFATARGWRVVAEYEDVDFSAANPRVRRPAFESMLHDLSRGQFDGVLVWKLDRLVRRPAQFEEVWSLLEGAGGFVASATEPVDTSNPFGVAIVRMLVTFASLETATQSVRIKAKLRELAESGKAPSTPRPFGHERGWKAIVLHEAELIREAARRVLEGDSLRSITSDWSRRGIRGMRGGQWSTSALRHMLISHRVVGDREHCGEVVATDCFPAILDRTTAAAVRLALVDYRRQPGHTTTPRWLLTGVVRCSKCGEFLRRLGTKRTPTYQCPAPPSGCGGTGIVIDPTDAVVTEAVLERCGQLALDPPRESRWQQRPRVVHEVDRSLRQLNLDYYSLHILSRDEFLDARRVLRLDAARQTRLETELPRLRESWWSMGVPARKRAIQEVVDDVIIGPSNGGRVFKAERIHIVWAEAPDARRSTVG